MSETTARIRALPLVSTWTAIAAGWIGFVLVTERWRPWGDAVRLQYATDVEEYETIARAAPGFPSIRIQTPHADRFPVHWTVGEVHRLLDIGLHPVYWIATCLVLAATFASVHATLRALRASTTAYALCFGAVVASAYPTRYLLEAPGMLTDALFVLGLAVIVHGFVTGRFELVVAGLVAATLGRQNAVPLAVVVAACVLLEPRWRTRRVAYAAIGIVVAAVVYIVPHETSQSWAAGNGGHGVIGMTVGGDWTPHTFASHVGRCVVAVAIPAALVVLGWWRGRRHPLWVPLALGLCVFLQAVALAPDWSHAEPRLAGLALPALAVAAAPALGAARLGSRERALVVVGIALASLHHLYSNVGVHRTSEWGALVAVGCLLVLAPALGRPSPR